MLRTRPAVEASDAGESAPPRLRRGMMMPLPPLLFQMLFLVVVASTEHYRVMLAERRRLRTAGLRKTGDRVRRGEKEKRLRPDLESCAGRREAVGEA